MKFYILNQVWGTNFIPDDSADFGFKNFFIPKTTILLLYRCVWKWFFPKYCHYFSFYDFVYTIFTVVDRTKAIFGIIQYSVQFGIFRKNQTKYLQDKIKDKRVLRSFLEKYIF